MKVLSLGVIHETPENPPQELSVVQYEVSQRSDKFPSLLCIKTETTGITDTKLMI